MHNPEWYRVASLAELREKSCLSTQANGHTVALFAYGDEVYAVDNRCPHMGFPLDRGTVRDGVLTCYWHYARFDLRTGGTFDLWADDVRAFPVEIRDGDIWIDVSPRGDQQAHHEDRLLVGLEQNLSLVVGKAALALLDGGGDPVAPFRAGLAFGTRYRQAGWGQGLTILTCMMNLLPLLNPADRPRALFHGLSAVANDTAGSAPRFLVRPLPGDHGDMAQLKRWFRRFVEVRDSEGAERCVISAVRAGATPAQLADLLFAAVTDHRYIDIGHPADFTNKAFEALDISGWEMAEWVLTSLVAGYTGAERMEESNAWRNPIDLVAILEESFLHLDEALVAGRARQQEGTVAAPSREALMPVLHGDDPQAIAEALLEALRLGTRPEELAAIVTHAAALRIARFHTSNEFGDWDTALHTFTFANAIEQGLRRAPSAELLRGVFDAAMSVYLDRFLNIPAARLPQPNGSGEAALDTLPALLNRQQQVNPAGEAVAHYLYGGGERARLLATLGNLLLREDRDFHTIQTIEAAFRQVALLEDDPAVVPMLVAAARYLAAHAPTMRAQGQTYSIAARLHRGERIFEG